jgi:hypothetical protein
VAEADGKGVGIRSAAEGCPLRCQRPFAPASTSAGLARARSWRMCSSADKLKGEIGSLRVDGTFCRQIA